MKPIQDTIHGIPTLHSFQVSRAISKVSISLAHGIKLAVVVILQGTSRIDEIRGLALRFFTTAFQTPTSFLH